MRRVVELTNLSAGKKVSFRIPHDIDLHLKIDFDFPSPQQVTELLEVILGNPEEPIALSFRLSSTGANMILFI